MMFLSRLIHPDAVGRFTENGNQIGEFTLGGTIGLLVFGGLAGGLFAGAIWVFVREWIPDNPLLVGLGTLAIGGFLLIEADNPDFAILDPPVIDLILLLCLVFLFGVVLHRLDRALDSRLPLRPGPVSAFAYGLLTLFGIAVAIPAFGNFFSSDFCGCAQPPIWTGVLIAAAAVATLWWWALDLRGAEAPPSRLHSFGRLATAGAVVAGAVHLTMQVVALF
jgi:hypothetical protein